MTPSEASQELRRIAAAIDNSKKPSFRLVAADIRKLIAQVTDGSAPVVAQQEQQAIPSSNAGKQMLGDALKAAQEALAKGDVHGLNKAVENIQKAHK